MTLGVTGVFWLPRTATGNSTALLAGAGPVPLSVASGSWTALASSYVDVAATVTRVMAGLAASWDGESATAAQSRLGSFLAWVNEVSALATESAAKAGAQAAAYTTALAVMPSIPEIAAVKTAKAAAYSTGGAVNGTAEAAEAADRALDIRAALVMEGYEAATSVLAIPRSCPPPPRIAVSAASVAGPGVGRVQRYRDGDHDVFTQPESGAEAQDATGHRDPARTVASAVESMTQNPNVTSPLSQAATSAQSVASSVGNAGSALVTNADGPVASGHRRSSVPAPVSASSTSTAGIGSLGGAGGSSGLGAMHRGAFSVTPLGTSGVDTSTDTTPYAPRDGVIAGPLRGAGAPIAGARTDPDDVHDSAYDDRVVQFDAGTVVVPSVIGGDPALHTPAPRHTPTPLERSR